MPSFIVHFWHILGSLLPGKGKWVWENIFQMQMESLLTWIFGKFFSQTGIKRDANVDFLAAEQYLLALK